MDKRTCDRCKGNKYEKAYSENVSKHLKIVDGVALWCIPAVKCGRCKGTGIEPDCKTCGNRGVIQETWYPHGPDDDGQTRAGPCYSCDRGRGLMFHC